MSLLLVQMTVVLLTALVCGWIALRLGQARVIGEIIGGIMLGPSVFGRIAPHAWSAFFPPESFSSFEVLSNVGLILFMFLIGTELDYEHLRRQKATATLTSATSMVLPFAMAVAVAPLLRVRFGGESIGALPFTLFLGISMSITAFPVLARILEERRMQSSPLGGAALMCAAVDDVSAWTLLAVALTLLPSGSHSMPIWLRLLGLGGYLLAMTCGVRPLGRWLARRWGGAALSYQLLAITVSGVLASAAATDALGVHPLFGAFVAGVCLPRVPHWQTELRARLDTIVSVLLLPLFFALTGMKTRLDLLSGAQIWSWTGLVLLLAMGGKVGGVVAAARWTGQPWSYAWALGFLLNTRGLVELVVLNIAYNAHVFSPILFTMLVVMALVTTTITTPALNRLRVGEQTAYAGK